MLQVRQFFGQEAHKTPVMVPSPVPRMLLAEEFASEVVEEVEITICGFGVTSLGTKIRLLVGSLGSVVAESVVLSPSATAVLFVSVLLDLVTSTIPSEAKPSLTSSL